MEILIGKSNRTQHRATWRLLDTVDDLTRITPFIRLFGIAAHNPLVAGRFNETSSLYFRRNLKKSEARSVGNDYNDRLIQVDPHV